MLKRCRGPGSRQKAKARERLDLIQESFSDLKFLRLLDSQFPLYAWSLAQAARSGPATGMVTSQLVRWLVRIFLNSSRSLVSDLSHSCVSVFLFVLSFFAIRSVLYSSHPLLSHNDLSSSCCMVGA